MCRSKIGNVENLFTSVTFLSLRNFEAAPEEAMHPMRLIKSSNESLGPYLFGNLSSGCYNTSKSPGLIVLNEWSLA